MADTAKSSDLTGGQIAGIGQGVSGLISSIYGITQLGGDTAERKRLQRELKKTMANRPTYTAPSQVDEILGIRKSALTKDMTMPGLGRAKEAIGASTSSAVGNIREMSNSVAGSLGAVSNVYKNEMNLLADLDVKGAMYSSAKKQAAEDAYAQALQTKADYVDKAWNWNTGQKYQEDYNYLSGRITQKSQQEQADRAAITSGVGDVIKGTTSAIAGFF